MPQQREYQLMAQLVYDQLAAWVGADAHRSQAEIALAMWKRNGSLSTEVVELVLDHFRGDKNPVPFQDFLPEPPVRTMFTHCNWVGGCDEPLSEEDGSLLCKPHRDEPLSAADTRLFMWRDEQPYGRAEVAS